MEDMITISSIRISKNLAMKLNLIAKRNGISKTEVIRRSLEQYLEKEPYPELKSAEEILQTIYKRTGRIPTIQKTVEQIYKENYQVEPL